MPEAMARPAFEIFRLVAYLINSDLKFAIHVAYSIFFCGDFPLFRWASKAWLIWLGIAVLGYFVNFN